MYDQRLISWFFNFWLSRSKAELSNICWIALKRLTRSLSLDLRADDEKTGIFLSPKRRMCLGVNSVRSCPFAELYFLIFPLALELSTLALRALDVAAAVRFRVLAFALRRGVVTLLPGAAVVGLVVLRSNVSVPSPRTRFL